MPFVELNDVITRLRSFHEQRRGCYARLAEGHPDERLALLLEYMQWHERVLGERLATFQERSDHKLGDTWIQNIADDQVQRVLDQVSLEPEMDAERVIRTALEMDRALIALYRQLATTSTLPPAAQAFFVDLLEMEETKGRQRSRSALELWDIGG